MDLSRVAWRKSRHSGNGANCVETAVVDNKVDAGRLFLIRDSKNPDGAFLVFSQAEWDGFIDSIKEGKFNDLG